MKKQNNDKWYEIRLPKAERKKGNKTWVKGNSGKKWYKEMIKHNKQMTELLRPRVSYDSKYGMFSINWGEKPVHSSIVVNFLSLGDLVFDVTKNGTIIGLEFQNFDEVLKRCDWNKKENVKGLNKMFRIRREKKWKK